MAARRLDPVTPGEILKHEFMAEHGLSANKVAAALGVPTNRITGIITGRRAVTADTALRLGRYFGTGPELWMNLQSRFDLETAKDKAESEIRRRVRPIRSELSGPAGTT